MKVGGKYLLCLHFVLMQRLTLWVGEAGSSTLSICGTGSLGARTCRPLRSSRLGRDTGPPTQSASLITCNEMVAPRTLFLFLVYCQLLPSPSQLHHTLPSPDSMRNRMQLPNSRVMGMLIWFAERPHRAKQPTKIQLKGSAACYPGSTALCVSPSFGVSLSFTAWTLVGFHLALDFYFIFLAQVDNLLLLCFHAKMSLKITFSFSEVFAQHSAGLILLENTSWCSARQRGCEYVYPPGYPGVKILGSDHLERNILVK